MEDQGNIGDKEKYIRELRDQVAARQRENEISERAFLESATPADLKVALEKMSVAAGDAAIAKAIAIIGDGNQEATIRILAMQKVVATASDNSELISLLLQILGDPNENTAVRREAFKVLDALTFSSRELRLANADFKATLRSLVDDADREIRERAAESLAQSKDEYIQRRLLEELRNDDARIVSRAKAIQLLGYDIHAEHFPLVRQVLTDANSSEVEKVEAIHVLANDSSSRDLLMELMSDKSQTKEIRLSSASALQVVAPEEFVQIAKESVLDDNEDADIRASWLNGIRLNITNTSLRDDSQFSRRIDSLRLKSASPQLKDMSKKFMQEMRKRDRK